MLRRIPARGALSRCACAALVLHGAACRAPHGDPPPAETRYSQIRPEWDGGKPEPSREWIAFSAGWLVREVDDADPVGDGAAFGLEVGFDLGAGELVPALELGLGYASVRGEAPLDDDLNLWRTTVGLRATWRSASWRPWLRGGVFVRWSPDDFDEPEDPYASGVYAGAGADWPYLPGMSLGPRLTWYGALDEDAVGDASREWLFALGATFRL
ncbi:MAG: hypothetical protein JNK02_17305 [Planctomycetes bacterium]|nr:hypothetical protein [Planctomycetota bacterium]